MVKVGHDLVEMRDQYSGALSDDSSARQQSLSPQNVNQHPDEFIVHEVQPLVNAQAIYIE